MNIVTLLREFGGPFRIAILTAVTTLLLAIVLNAVLGGAQRELIDQAVQNGQETLDHAVIARCELAHVVDILKEIGDQSTMLDLTDYADINIDGLDCNRILREPFNPGLNYVDPTSPSPGDH